MIPVTTQGTVIVGEPIGTNDYVNAAIQHVLAPGISKTALKLVRFPFANCLMLPLRYCCNQKLMYLMRNVSPEIMLPNSIR
jgi:hypothetical protein